MSIYKRGSLRELNNNLYTATKGFLLWRKFNNKFSIQNKKKIVFVMPSNDRECFYCTLLYSQVFLQQNKELIILTDDSFLLELINRIYNKKIKGIFVDSGKLNMLCKYYIVRDFYPNLYLISIREPLRRKCNQLIGKNSVGLSELVCVGIFGWSKKFFNSIKRPRKIILQKNDRDQKLYENFISKEHNILFRSRRKS